MGRPSASCYEYLVLWNILAQEPICWAAVSRHGWAGVGDRDVHEAVEWLSLYHHVWSWTCQFLQLWLKNGAGGRPYSS